jgi:hypothetical protein
MTKFYTTPFDVTSDLETPAPSRGEWSFVPVDIPELDHYPARHMELLLPRSGESTRALYLVRRTVVNVYGGVREGPHGREVCCPLPPLIETYVNGGIYHEGEVPLVLPGWHKAIRPMSQEEFLAYLGGMMTGPKEGA